MCRVVRAAVFKLGFLGSVALLHVSSVHHCSKAELMHPRSLERIHERERQQARKVSQKPAVVVPPRPVVVPPRAAHHVEPAPPLVATPPPVMERMLTAMTALHNASIALNGHGRLPVQAPVPVARPSCSTDPPGVTMESDDEDNSLGLPILIRRYCFLLTERFDVWKNRFVE